MKRLKKTGYKKFFKQLKNDGIIALKSNDTRELIKSLKIEVERSLNFQSYKKIGGSIAGHLNFSFGNENLDEINQKLIKEFLPYAKKYLGTNFCKVVVGGNINLPNSVNQHWHADSYFTDNWLIMNLLIDDFSLNNGATEFVERTHKRYFYYIDYLSKRYFGNFEIKNLANFKKGDLIIRDSNLWHRGTKNKTKNPRAMLSISFCRSNRDYIVTANDEKGFYPNWFGEKRWIELIYVYLPILFSLKRFFTSLKHKLKKL